MDSAAPVIVEHANNNGYKYSSKKRGGWNAAIFIIFVEIADRFAYYGMYGNLFVYLTSVLHESDPTAAKNINLWVGVSSLFPIIGALIADSFFGRFRTIVASSLIYVLGTVLLSLSVSVIPMDARKPIFFVALYILSVGEGGHKPCVQTFAADQFDDDSKEEREAKASFFNWWYLGIVFGATAAIFLVTYVQDNIGWAVGFWMLTAVAAAAFGMFLVGFKRYRKEPPVGSPITSVVQVLVAAARKWRVNETRSCMGIYYGEDDMTVGEVVKGQPGGAHILARTNQFRFLDKAAIIDNHDASTETRNPWRLCSQNQVEEVKLVLRLIPIWLSCLMFNVVQAQLHTYFIKQSSTMVRNLGPHFVLPPAILQGFVGFAILIAIPIYDKVFVPLIRKFTKHPAGITVLQRIGVGLFLSIINMVVSALVEVKRVNVAKKHNLLDNTKTIVPMKVWWLFPQFILCGVSDAFTVVGLQELYYEQMPVNMRSLGAAAYISITGVGNFLSSGVIALVQDISPKYGQAWLGNNFNRSHLDKFYWLLAALSVVSLVVYVWIAKCFVYKKIEGQETAKNYSSSYLQDGGQA
ncbi:hypothetical protein FNV43_RR25386 [Rhamnella rubrinervis]|uniref:Protein NRT1/ PTR FAMILY 5.4-like n=1 Tax=Rhamnella rubrinervis TaxID=2594499 RepID=A0A8K0DU57_9ROSA|nr:hypothetical protein FNV43_RR25386 [Rhamnella rubrinervis]